MAFSLSGVYLALSGTCLSGVGMRVSPARPAALSCCIGLAAFLNLLPLHLGLDPAMWGLAQGRAELLHPPVQVIDVVPDCAFSKFEIWGRRDMPFSVAVDVALPEK